MWEESLIISRWKVKRRERGVRTTTGFARQLNYTQYEKWLNGIRNVLHYLLSLVATNFSNNVCKINTVGIVYWWLLSNLTFFFNIELMDGKKILHLYCQSFYVHQVNWRNKTGPNYKFKTILKFPRLNSSSYSNYRGST